MPRFLRRLLARAERVPVNVHRRRPKLETLEDRSTPAVVNFVPFSAVAVNPSPLPATALIQFNPLPDVVALSKADTTIRLPVHVLGSFQQVLTSPMTTGGPGNGPPVILVVTYQFDGTVTGTTVAPTAAQPGSLTAHFQLTGKIQESLYAPTTASSVQPPWIITGTFAEKSDVSGALIAPAAAATDTMSFSAAITSSQTERRLSAVATNALPWSVQTTVQSAGKFEVATVLPPAPTPLSPVVVTTPFSLQDQINSSLTTIPANGTPPPPPVKVTAADNAAGTATWTLFPPDAATTPSVVAGTTQYLQQMTETIAYPPTSTGGGNTVTVGQVFYATGRYVNSNILPPPLFEDPGDLGQVVEAGGSAGVLI